MDDVVVSLMRDAKHDAGLNRRDAVVDDMRSETRMLVDDALRSDIWRRLPLLTLREELLDSAL